MYAVNLGDLMKFSFDFGVFLLLDPVLDRECVVDTEPGRVDGMAANLACDEDRAKAIVEILRMRFKKHELRLYQRTGETWRRV